MIKFNIKLLAAFLNLICIQLLINSCSFSSKTCKKLLNKSLNKSYDMVVVPGAPLEDGKWGRTMKGRIYWSKYLFEKGIAKNIMYSGGAVYTPYVEAEIMALYAEAIGIPKENIYVETKAEHSTENIYYSYHKARMLKFETVALASDPFQTKLLRRFVRKKVSPDVELLPFVVDTLKVIEPNMTDPEIDIQKAYIKDFVPISERESFWKRLRGTRGLNIDKNAYR